MPDVIVIWRCPHCGAALGEVRRSASGVRQLHVYRVADGSDVAAVVDGGAVVICSACRSRRRWVVGEEALARLLRSHKMQVRREKRSAA